MKENEVECVSCDSILDTESDTYFTAEGGNSYCGDCGGRCSNCETIDHLDELRYSESLGEHLCTDCSFSCERCDEYHPQRSVYHVDNMYYCEGCYENRTFHCEECDTSYPDHYDSYGVQDQTYCEGCYESNCYYCDECSEAYRDDDRCECEQVDDDRTCRCRSKFIHDYNCKPTPEFKGVSKHGLFMGFELECELPTRDDSLTSGSRYASEQLAGVAMLKHDGSLNSGFEIVTQPHTHLEYRENSKVLWDTINQLRTQYGARSWDTDTCGLHVHVSRAGFSSGAHTHRFMALIYKNAPEMMKFAGRKTRFARFNDVYTFDEYDRPVFSLKHKLENYGGERYSAVNTNNRDTLELRFFRGTMNPSGVLSALDLVQASVEYTRHLTLSDVKIGALSWTWFYDYVEQNNGLYPDLYQRMAKVASVDVKQPERINA